MPVLEARMKKIICSLRYLKHLLWNNGGIIILHNVYEMDLFSREKLKAKLYEILISDVLNKFQWPIVPPSPKRKWDASGNASGSSGFNRPELSCKCSTLHCQHSFIPSLLGPCSLLDPGATKMTGHSCSVYLDSQLQFSHFFCFSTWRGVVLLLWLFRPTWLCQSLPLTILHS